jgi:WXXGXW repeat (2 copies)
VRITASLTAIIAAISIAAVPLAAPAQFSVGVGFTIGSPPPPLPYYSQPPAPYPNYQWTPGYWAWGPAGYYWVPGTWVAPPTVGLYWTPGYWGYSNGYYGWNAGYWGASVGFYGGINYGFGYPGTGFYGGTWGPGGFAYNTAVANVNKTVIHNTYNKTVINKNVCNNCKNVSYNGGHGGINAKPTPAQVAARKDGRAPTTAQVQQAKVAGQDRRQYALANHGKPPVTAAPKPVTDPKQLDPHYAPVTAADKQAAAKTYGVHNPSAPANKAPATTNKAMTKPAPMTKPEQHKQPPQSAPHHNAMTTQQHHNAPMSHPQQHPQGGKPPQGHPQGNMQGKPPSSGQKPPNNNNNNGNGNKPPRHRH